MGGVMSTMCLQQDVGVWGGERLLVFFSNLAHKLFIPFGGKLNYLSSLFRIELESRRIMG